MKGITEFEVQLHEAGPDSKARVKSIFNYLQTTSDLHSKDLGTSVTLMSGQNLTWVFSRFYAVIDRYPDLYEKIRCQTWRSTVKNGLVSREYIITGNGGETLVRGTSSLALIDRTSRKPVSIPDNITAQLEKEKGQTVDFPSSSIEKRDESDYTYGVKIRFEDIDVNSHMNNASYAGIFFESIFDKYRDRVMMKTIDISFKGEVVYGDELECGVLSLDGSPAKFYHRLFNKTKGRVSAHAITEWVDKI